MISESQQEQATLYALELLDADEAVAFERQIDVDTELRELVRDLQETAALLALAGGDELVEAPPALRERVWTEIHHEKACGNAPTVVVDRSAGVIQQAAWREPRWFPWSVAAMLSACAGALLWLYFQQLQELHSLRGNDRGFQRLLSEARAEVEHATSDTLAQMSFCALDPTPDFATAQPRAAVLWDAAHRQGKLRVNRLAPPDDGKDYQLWTVEAGRKDAVSAGVVHVDADGKAEISFQPVDADGKPVVAVAISLEQAGGSPTNKGPILLLGKF